MQFKNLALRGRRFETTAELQNALEGALHHFFEERTMLHRLKFRRMFSSALLLSIAVWGLSACGRLTGPELPAEVTFEATWAGERWQGDAGATFFPTPDTLYISATNPVGAGETSSSAAVPLMHLRMRVSFQGVGSYDLGAGAVELIYLLGGDMVTAQYATTATHTGMLVIEEITSERVRGRVAFEAVSRSDHLPVGQQARFEGSFNARFYSTP